MTLDVKKIEYVTGLVVEIAHKTMFIEAHRAAVGSMNESAVHIQHLELEPDSSGQKRLPNERHPLVSTALQGVLNLRVSLCESIKRLESEVAHARQRLQPYLDEEGYHGHLEVADFNFVEKLLQERVASTWRAEIVAAQTARAERARKAVAG